MKRYLSEVPSYVKKTVRWAVNKNVVLWIVLVVGALWLFDLPDYLISLSHKFSNSDEDRDQRLMFQILEKKANMTQVQFDEYMKGLNLIGRNVRLREIVWDVKLRSGSYVVFAGTFNKFRFEVPKSVALSLNRLNIVTFTGEISDVKWNEGDVVFHLKNVTVIESEKTD